MNRGVSVSVHKNANRNSLSELTDGHSDCSQSESLVVCDVDEDLVKKLKEFRFRKQTNNAAIISELYMLCWDRRRMHWLYWGAED